MEQTNKNQLTIYEKERKKEYFKRYYELHRETILERAKEYNKQHIKPKKDKKLINIKRELVLKYL